MKKRAIRASLIKEKLEEIEKSVELVSEHLPDGSPHLLVARATVGGTG